MLGVPHEISFAKRVSNKVLFMEDGAVLESGDSGTFFAAPKLERTGEFLRTLKEHGN